MVAETQSFFKMSTLFPDLKNLDGPNDLQPAVKTSRIIAAETPKAKKTKKTTKES